MALKYNEILMGTQEVNFVLALCFFNEKSGNQQELYLLGYYFYPEPLPPEASTFRSLFYQKPFKSQLGYL